MMIARRLSEAGASEESIQRLEIEFGLRLPEEYRRFLASFNGGKPVPSGFSFETNEGLSESSIRYFLTLDTNAEHYTIWEFLVRYRDRIPSGLLPVACDSFENLVLIDVGAKEVGSVYFWDHEKESMDEPTWENISLVAPSFTALEQTLH